MTPAAMIFAAGFGTRMGALTETTPKPMLPLAGRPMIDHAIDHLKDAGIIHLVANTHYLPEKITPHLHSAGVQTNHEDTILETGGGLRAALPLLGTYPVITMNPDVVWKGPNPVTALLQAWQDNMQALLMLVPSPEARERDDFSLKQGEIARSGPFRYTGLQLLRTDWLSDISDPAFSLNAYWDHLMQRGPIHGTIYPGTWRDVGTADGLNTAEKMMTE